MSGNFVLPFGKYSGYALKDVPLAYVKWLCCFEHVWRDGMVVTQELSIPSPRQKYVLSKQWPTMLQARHFAEDARMCFECFHVMAEVRGVFMPRGVTIQKRTTFTNTAGCALAVSYTHLTLPTMRTV